MEPGWAPAHRIRIRRACRETPMRMSDLRLKEVINICDGKRLGFLTDACFDCKTGCILEFIIPGPAHICGFLGRDSEYVIPFGCVEQIGEDFVLIKAVTEECLKKYK